MVNFASHRARARDAYSQSIARARETVFGCHRLRARDSGEFLEDYARAWIDVLHFSFNEVSLRPVLFWLGSRRLLQWDEGLNNPDRGR